MLDETVPELSFLCHATLRFTTYHYIASISFDLKYKTSQAGAALLGRLRTWPRGLLDAQNRGFEYPNSAQTPLVAGFPIYH